MTQRSDLADRYGTPSPARATFTKAAVMLVAVIGLVWLAWAAFFHSTPEARSGLVGYDVVDDHTVEVTVDVQLSDTDAAECLVQAMSADKAIVGELAFTAAEGRNKVSVRTERRATNADLTGCRTEGQQRWR